MQIINNIDQSSDEWQQLRIGFITASRFKDVLAKGAGKTRASYMKEIAAEIITGEAQSKFTSKDMEWGTETEPQAIAMYEFDKGIQGERIAFASIDNLPIGCSPDLVVSNDGLAEFKCPRTTTQIDTFLSGVMPSIHMAQVQGQMWVMERDWCDFVSFDPRISVEARYFCKRVYRDEDYIKNLKSECLAFIDDLYEMLGKLGHNVKEPLLKAG